MNRTTIKSTPFGPVGVIWASLKGIPTITRVILSRPGVSAEDRAAALYPRSSSSSCKRIDKAASAIKGFLEGEAIEFSLSVADLSVCSDFQRRVLRAEYRIPRGKVSTYQFIARHLGKSGFARAVGNALAANPFPIIIPCHRAIRSDRHPGGYQGGVEMKRALLEMEGHHLDEAGRIDCVRFHYGRQASNKSSLQKG